MDIVNGDKHYQIDKMVAEVENEYRLYLCVQKGVKDQRLMQIGVSIAENGALERSAFQLRKLELAAYEIEEEYARLNPGSKKRLDYQLGFPAVIDSFVCADQGMRRINILGFRNVECVNQMVPLTNITQKDKARIDVKTSAWILGKLLKELVFIHNEGYSFDLLTADDILIEPEQHYSMVFNWPRLAKKIDHIRRRKNIAQATIAVMAALGYNQKTGVFPNDGDEHFEEYTGYLLRLARGEFDSAMKAHQEFYEIVYTIWPRTYHEFTEIPVEKEE
jgi:hypothetical protein